MDYPLELTPEELFPLVWREEFEPALRAKRRRADEHRTEAMIDAVLTLCGEPVRQITPQDLFTLDAIANPFVAGAEDGSVNFIDCAGLIWELHPRNNHTAGIFNLWRRAQVVQRLACLPIEQLATEIEAYLARMRLDDRETTEAGPIAPDPFRPEPKTHFMVPLLTEVVTQLGPTDPVSGLLMSQIPLPRLIQYRRAMEENKAGEKTYSEADSLRNRCMDRVNQIVAARRAAADS